ncbi:hypothetical protein KY285_033162 [Solanum tuberosum]|nr:hypothetical protein KY285_033162 [Solanum tuberosum]
MAPQISGKWPIIRIHILYQFIGHKILSYTKGTEIQTEKNQWLQTFREGPEPDLADVGVSIYEEVQKARKQLQGETDYI